uniref:Pleckstrin homology domain containing A7 n=1 Tax=Callorhinchus milii TaxID=7868 RepID=A0A4W3IQZ7_CALMI
IMAADLRRETLPDQWSYGVCRDGRVYFIDDETQNTSWLHPRTGVAVNSGHITRTDLPRGWEEGFSDEGRPILEQPGISREPNIRMSKQQADQRPSSMVSESSTAVTLSTMDTAPGSKVRSSGRIHNFGKREQSIRRNPNAPVVVRGWLYKQDSSGMKLWKRRWFVLSEYCLFYYKDSREDTVLGSIPLPSYVVAPIEPEDHIGRKYAFKATHTGMRTYIYSKNSLIGSQAEHTGMRTYYFSADTQEDMSGWIRAMNQAALMQAYTLKRETGKEDRPLLAQSNHINVCKGMARAEGLQNKADSRRPDETFGFEKREEIKKEREDEERYGFRKDTVEMAVGKGGRKRAQASPTQSDEHAAHPQLLPRHHPAQRNGTLPPTAPSAGPAERNGGAVYRRGFVPRTGTEKNAQRKSSLAQVEQWVKYHKTDGPRSVLGPTQTLPHRTSQSQPYPDGYQTLPRNLGESSPPAGQHLPSDYKYAQDRVLHLKMSNNERQATKDGMVWQLYEWQQRQQFKHGSPTAPLYPPHDFEIAKATLDAPRSISVPPSPSDIPPPPLPGPPKALSPRRPHNPADRVTIRPQEGRATEVPFLGSPTKHRGPVAKTAAHVDRRSMPPMGYMMHTVSAPSLHGKTADDTYMQLKKNLEYLDLKVSLNTSTSALLLSSLLSCLLLIWSSPQDKLESVLEVTHTQMEQYRGQPTHTDKIAYQQRLLQEDLVQIRAEISIISTEMENVWKKYEQTERDVNQLKELMLEHLRRVPNSQEQVQIRKDLRRIEDVMGGLSVSKSNYKVIMESIQNPDRRTVPSMPSSSVPSFSTTSTLYERRAANQLSPPVSPVMLSPGPQPQTQYRPHILPQFRQQPKPEDDAPPRPPLPHMYSPDDLPPAVPPLPKDATVIRHTSVRGLKRQSDERKRDREYGQYVNGDYKVKLRSYVSEPELMSVGSGMSRSMAGSLEHDGGFQTLPGRGLSSSSTGLQQSSDVTSHYVTLRRGRNDISSKQRPKSAVERLYGENQRGRMSAEEQLERMKRHQKALVRERKRTLSHGERHSTSSRPSFRPASADIGSWKREQDFDLQLLERAAQGEASREHDGLLKVVPVVEADVEPLDYDLDLSKELSKPDMVEIPERYINLEPNEPLTNEELETRRRKVQKIKSILAKSRYLTCTHKNSLDVDLQLQEQERLITMSYALASEASQRSKLVAAQQQVHPPAPSPPHSPLSNGFHYTFV